MSTKSPRSLASLMGLVVGLPACTVGFAPPPVFVPPPASYGPPPGRVAHARPVPGQPGPPPQGQPPGGPPNRGQALTGPPCSDPGERDFPNRADQAVPIESRSETVGCISLRDADMFVVTPPPAPGGQIIRFSLRGRDQMSPIIRLYDGDRKKMAEFGAPPNGRSTRLGSCCRGKADLRAGR